MKLSQILFQVCQYCISRTRLFHKIIILIALHLINTTESLCTNYVAHDPKSTNLLRDPPSSAGNNSEIANQQAAEFNNKVQFQVAEATFDGNNSLEVWLSEHSWYKFNWKFYTENTGQRQVPGKLQVWQRLGFYGPSHALTEITGRFQTCTWSPVMRCCS